MAPKRKSGGQKAKQPAKKCKSDNAAAVEKLLKEGAQTYCEELGIDLEKGGDAPFQWLCCSIIFSIGISEKTTIRAAKGLLHSGLTSPKSIKEADMREKIDAVNSEGNVQRGPSMSGRLESTAELVLEKYDGDLEKLREAAGKDAKEEMKLIKEFKGVGETAVNIFCREVQLLWDELFPFADQRTLETLAHHGISCSSAQEVADLVDNDRTKYVKLLAATTKGDLREGKQQNGAKSADDKKASTAAGNGKADKEATKEEEGEAEDKTEKQEKTGEDPQEQTAAGEQEAAEVEAEEGKDAEEKAPEKE